jgi:hypothetical protein
MDKTIEEVDLALVSPFGHSLTNKYLEIECEEQTIEKTESGLWRVRCKEFCSKNRTTSSTQGEGVKI